MQAGEITTQHCNRSVAKTRADDKLGLACYNLPVQPTGTGPGQTCGYHKNKCRARLQTFHTVFSSNKNQLSRTHTAR